MVCRLEVTRVSHMRARVNCMGYTPDGAYWGIGAPLFMLTLADEAGFEHTDYVRFMNETQLALYVRRKYPSATIGRRLMARLRSLELGALPSPAVREALRDEAHA